MDLSGRFDGQQFLAVFPGGSPSDAFQFAVRVRKEVEACTEFRKGGLTASAGVAEFRRGMAEERQLIDAASQALYAAKGAGRNRVMVRANDIDDAPQTPSERTARFGRTVPIAIPGPPEGVLDDPRSV
jgi:PleD family two-component response regulator